VYLPPIGYTAAKTMLIGEGHEFERTRREAGFEAGAFVDGALTDGHGVIALAELPRQERERRLDEQRRAWKHFACGAVEYYMRRLRVSLAELTQHVESQLQGGARMVRVV
jgi:hypothetical protein